MTRPAKLQYDRPWLYPKQERASFCEARYSWLEASTKSGKTTGASAWLTEETIAGKRGEHFWWVAPITAQARIVFERIRIALPRALYVPNETRMTLTMFNGAVIDFKSGEHPDSLFGEDVQAMVIDEASRLREASWHACRTTLTYTKGPVRIIGNVRGRKNWFYRGARKAESGEPDHEYHRITAADAIEAGVLDRAEVADAKAALPGEVFKQLYEAIGSDDDGNPFGLNAIAKCVAPLSANQPMYYGIDVAKYVDWTVIVGLDGDGRTAEFVRFQKPWEETFATVGEQVGNARALADSTGVGDAIVERLQGPCRQLEGFVFSSSSKQKLMEGLAVAIQHGEVSYPEGPISIELEQFEYLYTRTGVRYSAPEGMHDDCVCALALAVLMKERASRRGRWGPVYAEGEERPGAEKPAPVEYWHEIG